MSDQPSQDLACARECVARLKQAQATLGLKNRAFIGRFKDDERNLLLGSTRTWERISADDWRDNKPEKWLNRLRQACAQIDGGTPVDEVLVDMPFYVEASNELARLEAQQNDRRIMVVLCPTGTGKSVWGRSKVSEARATRTYLRAQPGWRENGIAICAGFLEALTGETKKHNEGYHDLLSKLRGYLSSKIMTVFMDEAHEGGIELMKIVRYLVDETRTRFVYLAYPTEYQKVVSATSGSLTEARQFIGRALKPIFDDYMEGTKVEDVTAILKRAGFRSDTKLLAQEITPRILRSEGLRTLDDAMDLARSRADEDTRPTGKELMEALEDILGTSKQEERGKKLLRTLEREAA